MRKLEMLVMILMVSGLFSAPVFADDTEEGPEAPPTPIDDWIPVLFIAGAGLVCYRFYKNKPSFPEN